MLLPLSAILDMLPCAVVPVSACPSPCAVVLYIPVPDTWLMLLHLLHHCLPCAFSLAAAICPLHRQLIMCVFIFYQLTFSKVRHWLSLQTRLYCIRQRQFWSRPVIIVNPHEGMQSGPMLAMLLQGIAGLDNAQTILDLTGQIPDIISDLLGYSVVPQQLQENQLLAGDMFNTTNVIKTGTGVNGVPAYIPIDIKTTTDMTQVGTACPVFHNSCDACMYTHLVTQLELTQGIDPSRSNCMSMCPVTEMHVRTEPVSHLQAMSARSGDNCGHSRASEVSFSHGQLPVAVLNVDRGPV